MNGVFMTGSARAFALAIGLIAAAGAEAASVKPTTHDALATCLAEAEEARVGQGARAGLDTRRACVFKGAAHCLDRRPGAELVCHDEERAAWDEMLNQAYARLRAVASPPLFAAIQGEQRAWLPFRDAMCRRFYDAEGVTSLAQSAERACLAKETAHRALFLEDTLADIRRLAGD